MTARYKDGDKVRVTFDGIVERVGEQEIIIGAVPKTPAALASGRVRIPERPLWTGDGSEEPPAWVTRVVSAVDSDVCERNENGWWWTGRARRFLGNRRATDGWPWDESMQHWGPFTEVRDA